MRGRIAVAAALALLLALPAAARGADPVSPAPPSGSAPQALAVQPAASGTLTPVRGAARTYDLVLRGVSPLVDVFDDSPGTGTQRVALAKLLPVLFAQGAARRNAAISVGRRTMAVTLLRARHDRRRATIRYRVRALRGARALPRRFSRPTLFIDDFGGFSCHGNINNSTSLALNPIQWEDPGSLQQMVSDPGYAAPNTATDWESTGRFVAAPCSVSVIFEGIGADLRVMVAVEQNGMVSRVTCLLDGAAAHRFRCVLLWDRLSGMTRDASWQLLPA